MFSELLGVMMTNRAIIVNRYAHRMFLFVPTGWHFAGV